jgi:hypothetical protein
MRMGLYVCRPPCLAIVLAFSGRRQVNGKHKTKSLCALCGSAVNIKLKEEMSNQLLLY